MMLEKYDLYETRETLDCIPFHGVYLIALLKPTASDLWIKSTCTCLAEAV